MTATTIAPPLPVPRLERLRWAARDGWLIAQRDVAQWVREPQMTVWGLVFPIVFVLLFAFVFGSGIIVLGAAATASS